GRIYGDEPNQKYMVYRDSIKLVWVDLYAEDFYYTLNIIEKIERISVITPEDITKSLTEKGEAILYFNFDRGDCTLKEECKPVLETLVEVLKADPTLNLSVIAFTDNAGRASDNKLLSENRAKTLCTTLVELGIAESRLISEGRGEEEPIADNSTLEGRSLNNRIVLIKK
ncbi:MAG: OmpA family protein, partial [Bacteroidales bacterium]|nr:OmpA family protein [Bacteroidales bacterium]